MKSISFKLSKSLEMCEFQVKCPMNCGPLLFCRYRNGEQTQWNSRRALRLNRNSTIFVFKALSIAVLMCCSVLDANSRNPTFRVIAFFTAKQDQAHISFVREANRWFPEMATKYNFSYESTSDWQTFLKNIKWLFFWTRVPKILSNELLLRSTWTMAAPGWAFTLPASP